MKNKIKIIYRMILILYSMILIYMTLLKRNHYDEPLGHLWSGWIIKKCWDSWNFDPLFNLFLLTPIILLLYLSFPKLANNHPIKRAIPISFCVSAFIECNQLIFSLGTFQISDLVYNTISGTIGAIVYLLLMRMIEMWKKRKL